MTEASMEQAQRPERTSDEPVLRVKNVYKVFGKRPDEAVRRMVEENATREDVAEQGVAAVIDASFEVKQGEIFVVMGLSGSGKSTLIRTLNALQPATSGTVEVMGKDLSKLSKQQLRKSRSEDISMVFQHFALFPHWTVLNNAAYGLEIQGVGKQERHAKAKEILKAVGLEGWEDRYPEQLSGGMQQRVGLARALAAGNGILLMDEAFSALDPLIRREMQNELVTLQRELGRTIIFITHDLNEAMFLGDRIAVMKDGRIVQIGTPEEILNNPADDYVASFIADVDRSRVLSAGSIMVPAEELSVAERTQFDHDKQVVPITESLQQVVPKATETTGPIGVVDPATGSNEVVGYITTDNLLTAMVNTDEEPAQESSSSPGSTTPPRKPQDAVSAIDGEPTNSQGGDHS